MDSIPYDLAYNIHLCLSVMILREHFTYHNFSVVFIDGEHSMEIRNDLVEAHSYHFFEDFRIRHVRFLVQS
jgi:hypothetical protein